MKKHIHTIRYAYVFIIGFLVGVLAISYLGNPRQTEIISSKDNTIDQQEKMITVLLEELKERQ